ncbi:MAG: alpha-E domain-containing protein [Ectothiorhodospiraceae bacterium]|nr:alpha-E domain-containing protein [Ectothiorhodospiraceae bacterium]
MLSRVAETLYWLGRYAERAEDTARLVNVNAHLLLDLPRGLAPGWRPLVAITGSEDVFQARYPDYEERHVVRFLIGDRDYPSSVLASLRMVRENARTIRDIVPREVWELVNALYLDAQEHVSTGLSKRGRHAYLSRIIRGAQTLAGMLDGTMSHDVGYEFLRIGRNLERADMTTRIIDVRSADLLAQADTELRPFENIQWMSVLKSLTAYQMYRRTMQVRVRRSDALRFLLQDQAFPRAFYHCVVAAETGIAGLPRPERAARVTAHLKRQAQQADVRGLADDATALHAFVDQLQVGLGRLHEAIAGTWFPGADEAAEAPVVAAQSMG